MTRREAIRTGVAVGAALALPRPGFGREDLPAPTGPVVPERNPPLSFTLNGYQVDISAPARVTLLDLLRERLSQPGTKKGCDHGQCGACTVLIDGARVLSCLTLAATVQGKAVTTIEGLARGDDLHPVQAAFLKHDGFQCGYCTPGQIMSAVGFLQEPWPEGRDAIREGMAGNLCRCGAYCGIVDAVEEARRTQARRGAA